LKLRDDFYVVTSITVQIPIGEFTDGKKLLDRWTDTQLFIATVNVKPYGTNDDEFSFIFEVNEKILRKWGTSK
jgi:hypothetical protein